MITPNREVGLFVVIVVRKLRPYFQAYIINVLIVDPLKKAMNKLEVAG